jgi:DNA/RNA endonuclease YhcR with UshA esterase domain
MDVLLINNNFGSHEAVVSKKTKKSIKSRKSKKPNHEKN